MLPADKPSSRPWWIWLGHLVLFAFSLGLAVFGGWMYALANRQKAEVEAWLNPPPPAEEPPEAEATAGTHAEMKVLFVTLGQAMAGDKFEARSYFDLRALAASMSPDMLEEKTGNHGWAVASSEAVRDLHQSLNLWSAEKTDVRRVVVSADGQRVRAVVWHPQESTTRKLRWTLRKTADGWRVTDWEDLRTGITGTDMALVCADGFNVGKRHARLGGFSNLPQVHHSWRHRRRDEIVTQMFVAAETARAEPRLRYAIDLMDGRMKLGRLVGLWCGPSLTTAMDTSEELVERVPERLAAYLLLAEACLMEGHPQRAVEAANTYLRVAGDDPDALALRGTARHTLGENAADDFALALALDPHQPLALDHRRKTADLVGKEAIADLLATAPEPDVLFEQLVERAEVDQDWEAVVVLAKKYITLRPKELSGVKRLVLAHVSLGQLQRAATALKTHLPKLSRADRYTVVWEFVRAMYPTPLPDIYALVPESDATTALRALGYRFQDVKLMDQSDTPGAKGGRAKAIAPIAKVLDSHRKAHPDDIWLAVYDGMTKNAERRYAEAADVILPALRRLSFADDTFKESDAAYCALRDELVIAWRETGKAAEAYRELQPKGWVFPRLVRRPPMDRDTLLPADELEKLLDAQKEVEGDTFDAPYWRAEVYRMRGQYTAAAELYRRYIDAKNPPFGSDWANLHRIARGRLIRCLVRGEPKVSANEADVLVAAHLKDSIGRESQVVQAVVWAYTGRLKEVAEWLRQQKDSTWDRHQLSMLYSDPDLGPILKGDPAFAVFRKGFPPPVDKPKLPR